MCVNALLCQHACLNHRHGRTVRSNLAKEKTVTGGYSYIVRIINGSIQLIPYRQNLCSGIFAYKVYHALTVMASMDMVAVRCFCPNSAANSRLGGRAKHSIMQSKVLKLFPANLRKENRKRECYQRKKEIKSHLKKYRKSILNPQT